MIDPGTLAIFALASAALIAVPGPAVLYIVTRSIHQGRRAGVASVLGIEAGALVHVAAAAVGLSALLASSAVAFSVVKYAGAAYLIGLGLWTLLAGHGGADAAPSSDVRLRRVFAQGVLVNAFNPKVALFFLAFLPQFVDPARGSPALQLGVLGVLLVGISMVSDTCYAMLTGTAGAWLRRRGARFMRRQRWVTGGIYVALGVSAAIAGSGSSGGSGGSTAE